MIEQADVTCSNDILEIINTSNRMMYRSIIPTEHFQDPYLSLDELLQDFDRMKFFVYKNPNHIVGVVGLEVESAEIGNIQRCYVARSYQREGVGTALVTHVEKIAKELGLRQIKLHVGESAYWATNFYRNLGYATIERQEHIWGSTLVMAKHIDGPPEKNEGRA
jgi:ribosomal protein S18 acetylase RimI-like enzyme